MEGDGTGWSGSRRKSGNRPELVTAAGQAAHQQHTAAPAAASCQQGGHKHQPLAQATVAQSAQRQHTAASASQQHQAQATSQAAQHQRTAAPAWTTPRHTFGGDAVPASPVKPEPSPPKGAHTGDDLAAPAAKDAGQVRESAEDAARREWQNWQNWVCAVEACEAAGDLEFALELRKSAPRKPDELHEPEPEEMPPRISPHVPALPPKTQLQKALAAAQAARAAAQATAQPARQRHTAASASQQHKAQPAAQAAQQRHIAAPASQQHQVQASAQAAHVTATEAAAQGAQLRSNRSQEADAFLGRLPHDRFTHKEVALRDAILSFVKDWQGSGPPSLTDAGKDSSVKTARDALLPKSINMKGWIDVRMGQELEIMQDAKGQHIIGLPGELDPDELAATDTGLGKRKQHNLGTQRPGRKGQASRKKKRTAPGAAEAEASYFVGFGSNFWW
eukprot:gnl/TRDRNA2_/TRDRNA2_177880_c1_seq31.p1 gnl/TRDRNA2_/TRDRNA2_177880_c1~~gnl/TRDRNA2_/TRDRNA2_177880_c1_seq31.p1  ORF type:complete len:517 (-),score=84.35 gnl/TRDRNA2_/TRDRNA2_177880_c1_seq31:709-2052(-)